MCRTFVKLSVVILQLAWVSESLHAAEPSADVLVQDSFETGTKEPDGWQRSGNVPSVKFVYDASNGSEGKRSLSLQKSENRYFPIAGWFKSFEHRQGHSTLNVTAKVKASKVTKAILDVQFLDQNQRPLSHEWAIYIGQKEANDSVATHDWKPYSGSVEIPEGTKSIGIAFQIYGPGKVWLDELDARYGAASDKQPADKPSNQSVTRSGTAAASEFPTPIELTTPSGKVTNYVLIRPDENAKRPAGGFPLLLVLPGGDGSIEFHPFVREIHRQGLGGRFVVAQMIAPPQIVWPTRSSIQRFATTEESIEAIVADTHERCGLDHKQVYALAWSSSGPAVYATILQDQTPLAGAFIAMSVFKPDQLPPISNAKGRRIYLLHSPADQVCPYPMAQDAKNKLAGAGAVVKLVDYEGGHGWNGPVFDNIRAGVDWLQSTPK